MIWPWGFIVWLVLVALILTFNHAAHRKGDPKP